MKINIGHKSKSILREMGIYNEILDKVKSAESIDTLQADLIKNYPKLYEKYSIGFRSEKLSESCLYLKKRKN